MRALRGGCAAALLLALAACAPAGGPTGGGGMLAIGDSVLAWNGGAGVPEAAATRLGLPLRDASRSGADLLPGGGGLSALVPNIQAQWARNAGRYEWVLMDGGANDLQGTCGTPAQDVLLDRLIGSDLRGPYADLVRAIRATGSKVAIMGYYPGLRQATTSFTGCGPVLSRLDARLERLAARDAGVVFADAGDAIDPANPAHYAPDRLHPSPAGSARIGAVMAAAMAR